MASQLETRQTDGGTLQLQYCGRGVAMPRARGSGLDIDTIHQHTIHLQKASICALTL